MSFLLDGSPSGGRLGRFDLLRDEILFGTPRVIHRVLEFIFVTLTWICAACTSKTVVSLFGFVPLGISLALGLIVLAIRVHRGLSVQRKATAAVAVYLLGSISTVFFTGASGLSGALCGGACILGLVVGTRSSRRWTLGLAAAAIWIPAASNGLGIVKLHEMRSTLPVDWFFVWLIAFPATAITLYLISQLTNEVRHKRTRVAQANAELTAEYAQVAESLESLNVLIGQQREEIMRRTWEIEALEADTAMLSSRCLGSILSSVTMLQGVVEELVSQANALPAAALSYLERALKRVQQMEEIVLGFRALAEPIPAGGEVVRVECTEIVRSVLQSLHEATPTRVYELEAPDELWLSGEPGLLEALIRNLVENSWKFSANQPVTRISISPFSNGSGCGFSIRDNGVGMDPESLAALFGEEQDPNSPHTGSLVGHGMGLLTVRQIVLRYQGTISVESELGAGSTFHVSLGAPLSEHLPHWEDSVDLMESAVQGGRDYEPDDEWMAAPIQLVLNWMIFGVAFTILVVFSSILAQKSWSVLVVALLLLAGLVFVRVQRRWTGEALALATLTPLTLGALGMWTFTADFSAPVSLSTCVLAMALLFLRPVGLYAVATLLGLSSVVGFFNLTGGRTSGLTEPISWAQYWVLGFAILAVPVVITLQLVEISMMFLTDAVHRLQQVGESSAHAIEAIRRLNREKEALRETLEQRIQNRLRAIRLAREARASLTNAISHDLRAPVRVCNNFFALVETESGGELSPQSHALLMDAMKRSTLLLSDVETTVRTSRVLHEHEPESMEDLAEWAAFRLQVWINQSATVVAPAGVLGEMFKQLHEMILDSRDRTGTVVPDGTHASLRLGQCREEWVLAMQAFSAETSDTPQVLQVHNFLRVCRALHCEVELDPETRILTLRLPTMAITGSRR